MLVNPATNLFSAYSSQQPYVTQQHLFNFEIVIYEHFSNVGLYISSYCICVCLYVCCVQGVAE